MAKKVTIFQMDDTENSPKIIDIGGSSMVVLYSPIACITEWLERKELENPGVYILRYDSDDVNFSDSVYIGEAEILRERLNQHLKTDKLEFKECIVVVSTKDGELTKAHIKNMESKLYQLSDSAKNSKIFNATKPTLSTLSLADESIVDEFIRQLKMVLPLCGFLCLSPTTAQIILETNTFIIDNKTKGIYARMVIENNHYIVLKDSTVCKDVTASFIYKKNREKLIDAGILVFENDQYKFTENTIFSSPSQPASIILGSTVNGQDVWKNNNGKTMKELQ
ncbi:conserved hypothetical protein [Treponema primitia ZAS-2]|uniref:GIY-YIG domain-containing protein n=1 Tax=Treponema primitia (strain ATCC BAA-887 / DSM 12427 / ZAS-2) TaxID=545694 RepID=F5YKM0_TREPZ|nr:GIY-YIG nuclease family protein [Treponema primitia]AEF84156.1 conserved hypothetical protein [Treponema primitia ZAS-2]